MGQRQAERPLHIAEADEEELKLTKEYDSKLNSAKKWRTFALVLSLFQFGIVVGIIVTWIFNFNVARTLVLISILEIGNVFSFVVLIVVFFQYRSWTKPKSLNRPMFPIMLILVTLESVSLIAIIAEFIWRIILIVNCTSGDPCSVDPQWTVAIVLLTICSISLIVAFFAEITAFMLFSRLKSVLEAKRKTSLYDSQRELQALAVSQVNGPNRNNPDFYGSPPQTFMQQTQRNSDTRQRNKRND